MHTQQHLSWIIFWSTIKSDKILSIHWCYSQGQKRTSITKLGPIHHIIIHTVHHCTTSWSQAACDTICDKPQWTQNTKPGDKLRTGFGLCTASGSQIKQSIKRYRQNKAVKKDDCQRKMGDITWKHNKRIKYILCLSTLPYQRHQTFLSKALFV